MDLYESFKLFLRKKIRPSDTDTRSIECDDAGLYLILEQLCQTSTKVEDQLVLPNHRLQKQLDIATVYAAVDKMNKRRLNKQDWMSSSDQLENDIIEWIIHTQSNQRFEL